MAHRAPPSLRSTVWPMSGTSSGSASFSWSWRATIPPARCHADRFCAPARFGRDGDNGRIVAPRDVAALTGALTEVAKGTPPVDQHEAIAARFDWDHIADNYHRHLTVPP